MASEWLTGGPRARHTLERTIAWLILVAAAPAIAAALWLVWGDDHGVELRWTFTVILPRSRID